MDPIRQWLRRALPFMTTKAGEVWRTTGELAVLFAIVLGLLQVQKLDGWLEVALGAIAVGIPVNTLRLAFLMNADDVRAAKPGLEKVLAGIRASVSHACPAVAVVAVLGHFAVWAAVVAPLAFVTYLVLWIAGHLNEIALEVTADASADAPACAEPPSPS